MNFKFCLSLCTHLFLLVTWLVTVVTMTLTKAFVQWFRDDVQSSSSVSIADYDLQPNIPVAAHVLLLALGMFVPTVTGLFWTCFKKGPKKRKATKQKIRIAHAVFLIVGIVAVCVLMFPMASSLAVNVNCSMYNGNCSCNNIPVSNNVCACKDLRISYFAFLIFGFIAQLLSLFLVSKLIAIRSPFGSKKVGQDAGNTPENTPNHTETSKAPSSTEAGSGTGATRKTSN